MVRVWRCRHQSRSGFFREFRVACRATFARCARLAPQSQRGDPAGLLIAAPNAAILYQTLAKAPLLGDAERALSTRHFLRELNRFGVTSAIDPSGGFQSLAILSADYFTVPDGKIADIEPLYMVAGGRVVYAAGEFEGLDEPFPDIAPGWSPVARYGGFRAGSRAGMALARQLAVMAAAQTDQRSD